MVKWLSGLWSWLRGLFRRRPQAPPAEGVLRTVLTAEIPEPPEPGSLFLVGEGEHLWFAVLECPCGCGESVQLNLLPDDFPCWEATRHADGTVSLWPSVRRVRGCFSHFFVRRGRIKWCDPDPPAVSPR